MSGDLVTTMVVAMIDATIDATMTVVPTDTTRAVITIVGAILTAETTGMIGFQLSSAVVEAAVATTIAIKVTLLDIYSLGFCLL